jgi:hypothetical protein
MMTTEYYHINLLFRKKINISSKTNQCVVSYMNTQIQLPFINLIFFIITFYMHARAFY